MAEQTNRKAYPTDLTDAEWRKIEPHVPAPKSLSKKSWNAGFSRSKHWPKLPFYADPTA